MLIDCRVCPRLNLHKSTGSFDSVDQQHLQADPTRTCHRCGLVFSTKYKLKQHVSGNGPPRTEGSYRMLVNCP